ncbi:M20/M25/M40 family metallo-hydrolase [Psychroflexus aestuariivivens]|uniref:M20/M25/M40 family metallo-hydrolase n=1 Tax=Psychroflexus aestuariivivens TaxID=1795040 RepID=UPI000FDAFE2A|nr:M20/M25/M40 family metallo-hydrolase [Psychroflexus aestuariivivens]
MKRYSYKAIFSLVIISFTIWYTFFKLYPSEITDLSTPDSKFSTERAFQHVKNIGDEPHFIGSKSHSEKRNYIVNQLEELGLEVQTQQDFVLSDDGSFSIPENIITKIPATDQSNPEAKSLLLLSHYDSAVHSSPGASDAASGIGAILEAVREFQNKDLIFQNDIIIVFTDAEEIGLMGAQLFAESHPWIENVGLVLNFESRGSGGPSNMIVETNYGNANLIDQFSNTNVEFPLANSLMYSVYKILPNDTDSTIFREVADVPSFFFAFIDDHYDYHTALDKPNRLDKRSLAHQGDYLTGTLEIFSKADLSKLKAEHDNIYFTIPGLGLFQYSFGFIWPLFAIALLLFLAILYYGLRTRRLSLKEILLGFAPWLASLILSGLISYFGWQVIMYFYPEYYEILQGFPYNGHSYIIFFVALTVFISFAVYQKYDRKLNPENAIVAPIFTWFILLLMINIFLKGAAFFIIPLFFTLAAFFIMTRYFAPSYILLLFLVLPALAIITPFIQFFPVGLGLKMVVISSIFSVLLFGNLLPVFGYFPIKRGLAALSLIIAIGFFIRAHLHSEFSQNRPKPNSLVYTLDTEKSEATWNTYDHILDDWNRSYFEFDSEIRDESKYASKYNVTYTKSNKAEVKNLPTSLVKIDTLTPSSEELKHFQIEIIPQRKLNRLIISETSLTNFNSFSVNGLDSKKNDNDISHVHFNRTYASILDYYVVNQEPVILEFEVEKQAELNFIINDISFDLLSHDQFSISPRTSKMIPKPFVVNDAIIVKQSFGL